MKRWLISLFAVICLVAHAKDKVIQNYVLDEQTVYVIPVATNRVTTISFPGPIAAIEAAQTSVDPKQPAPFLIAYKPDTAFVSVRAEKAKAATNINIRWNDQTYVLELIESDEPCLSVNFQIPPDTSALAQPAPVTPIRLLSLLDKAKAYPLLRAYHPEAVADVDYRNYGREPLTVACTNYAVRLEEAFRFNPEDTLVFHVGITNQTDRELVYPRDGFELRVGERTYPESISDASGVVPPHAETQAYFAVTGTPNGGRNDISIKNDFYVILHAHTVEPAAPVAPVTVPLTGNDSPTNNDESAQP
jgi:hypothetical protein